MEQLKGFYNDDTLKEKLHKGEITTLDYVTHQSEQMKQDFVKYCEEKELQQTEQSAQSFLEWSLNQEVEAHSEYLD